MPVYEAPPSTASGGALPRLYLPLVLLLTAVLAWQPLRGGDDFWAHAAAGRWIWQHGAVPRHTLFLWTARSEWIDHTWLTQVVFYALMRLGGEHQGPRLALALNVLLIGATVYAVWRVWASHARITSLTPLIFLLALGCASARFHPRPELFTAVFQTALLVFLVRWSDEAALPPRWQEPAAMVLMFALWANFHGAVAMGLAILGLTAACDLLQDRFNRRALVLLALWPACALAVFANPYGGGVWRLLARVGSPMFAMIDEWKPLWQPPALPPEGFVIIGVLLLLALHAWFEGGRRRWSHLAWLLLAALALASARRHLWTFSQICLVVMAANATALDTQRLWRVWRPDAPAVPPRLQLAGRMAVLAVLLVWIGGATSSDTLGLRAVAALVPEGAANYLRTNPALGLVFNDYLSSSYLEWRCNGQPPLFIDLHNAYPTSLLADYFHIAHAEPRALRWLDQSWAPYPWNSSPPRPAVSPDPARRIACVVLKSHRPTDHMAPLANFLDHDPHWRRDYSDNAATVWRRR